MNAQHSSETGEWYTPPRWIEAARKTLRRIDLDPCSSESANTIVIAKIHHTHLDNPLRMCWHKHAATGFVNPPGSCVKSGTNFSVCGNTVRCSCKLPMNFLGKSIVEAHAGMSIVYLAYSVNQLRQIARLKPPSMVQISIALPEDRIPFIDPKTMKPVRGTNCDSAFLCISRFDEYHDRFRDVFRREGCEVFLRRSEYDGFNS